jgi:hypothetical protein
VHAAWVHTFRQYLEGWYLAKVSPGPTTNIAACVSRTSSNGPACLLKPCRRAEPRLGLYLLLGMNPRRHQHCEAAEQWQSHCICHNI